jgi:hypothetical protein
MPAHVFLNHCAGQVRLRGSDMKLPEISSLGLPPEKHADRIIAEMLRMIITDRMPGKAQFEAIAFGKVPDGNPAAQARILKQLKAACRPFLFGTKLQSGKRGRYIISLIVVDGWCAERRALLQPNDAIPAKPWLALNYVEIVGRGNHYYDHAQKLMLFITHHALSRLAQRCGARTIEDIWRAAQEIIVRYVEYRVHESVGAVSARFTVKLDTGNIVCAIEPYEDGVGGMVLATLWKEGEDDENGEIT